MSLSTLSLLSSQQNIQTNSAPVDIPNNPTTTESIIFPTFIPITIDNDTINYTTATGNQSYRNGKYILGGIYSSWGLYRLFDKNSSTKYFGGGNAIANYYRDFDESVVSYVYDRNPYIINTTPANYQGGNSTGAYYLNTVYNGGAGSVAGEYVQIKFPFIGFKINTVYITPSSGLNISNSPNKFYILGSGDGISWTLIVILNCTTTVATEKSYSFTNNNQYRYYRFVIQSQIGGNSWNGQQQMAELRLGGTVSPVV